MTKYDNVDGYLYNLKEVKRTIETDVLVVGAGNAGLMAAVGAIEKGAEVLIVEKEDKINPIRLTIAGLGTNAQIRNHVEQDKYELVEYFSAYAQHRVDQKLIYHWANNCAETLNWIEDNVLIPNGSHWHTEKELGHPDLYYKAFFTEHDASADGKSYKPYGEWLEAKVKEMGADIRFKMPFVDLIKENDKVVGAVVKDLTTGEYVRVKASKGTILCTGGYSANQELLTEWNPVSLKQNVYNDSPRSNGAGLTAALNIGALKDEWPANIVFDRGLMKPGTKTTDMYHETENFENWLWIGSQPLLKVNIRGERFANESTPYDFITNAAAKQPGYNYAAIWDGNYKEYSVTNAMEGCAKIGFAGYMTGVEALEKDIEQYVEKGLVFKTNTLEELFDQLGLPQETAKKTVERYNELAAIGIDEDFGKESLRLNGVLKAPFYGAILGGRILATTDGLRINTDMEVLDENYEVIDGLYAAGNDSGGFFCGSYPELAPGTLASREVTFGHLAGQAAAMKH